MCAEVFNIIVATMIPVWTVSLILQIFTGLVLAKNVNVTTGESQSNCSKPIEIIVFSL